MTERQRRFADGILKGKSQREAYIEAGYKARGAAADTSAGRLLRNVEVAAYLDEKREKLEERTLVTQEQIIRELAKIAFSDMRNYTKWGPRGVRLRRSHALPPEMTAAVAEVSETTTEHGGSLRFKLHDKKGALDTLAKILGMLTERTINIDPALLSDEELRRIADGEDPVRVLASTRAG